MMAVSSNCCMNMSPPPSSSTSSSPQRPKTTTQVPWPKREASWRNKCVLGVACMIISLDTGNFMEERAIAGEMQTIIKSNEKIMRWSDKRKCAPWRLNSLETIVPENLPRPSARRGWEEVDYSKVNAPAVKVLTKTSNKCFSM